MNIKHLPMTWKWVEMLGEKVIPVEVLGRRICIYCFSCVWSAMLLKGVKSLKFKMSARPVETGKIKQRYYSHKVVDNPQSGPYSH